MNPTQQMETEALTGRDVRTANVHNHLSDAPSVDHYPMTSDYEATLAAYAAQAQDQHRDHSPTR